MGMMDSNLEFQMDKDEPTGRVYDQVEVHNEIWSGTNSRLAGQPMWGAFYNFGCLGWEVVEAKLFVNKKLYILWCSRPQLLFPMLYVLSLRFWKRAVATKILQYSAGQSSATVQREVSRCVCLGLHVGSSCVYLESTFITLVQAQPRLYSCLSLLSSPSPEHVNYTISGKLSSANCHT